MRLFLAVVLVSLMQALPAGAVDYRAFTDRMISGYIQPESASFAQSTAALKTATTSVCTGGTENARAGFADAFSAAATGYARLSFLRYGAFAEENRLERLAFLLDPRGIGQRQVRKLVAARDPSVLDPKTLAGKSVAVQGLTALQLLAFDKTGQVVLGNAGEAKEFTCGYAISIAENVALIAADLVNGWQAGSSLDQMPDKEASETAFNALVTGLIVLKDQQILAALGPSLKKARPQRIPFSRSRNGLAYLAAESAGIHDALKASGYAAYLPEDFIWIESGIDYEFGNIGKVLAEIPGPIRQTLRGEDVYGKFKFLTITINSLRDTVALELAGALNMSGGFNALDGD